MARLTTILGSFLFGLLLLMTVVIQVKIAPVLHSIMDGLGDSLWAPARLSINIANQGFILVPLVLVGVIIGHRRAESALKASVLFGACLLIVLQLALQLSLSLNFVTALPSHLGKGKFSTTPKVVDQPQQHPAQN